jgi:hypothetical protein
MLSLSPSLGIKQYIAEEAPNNEHPYKTWSTSAEAEIGQGYIYTEMMAIPMLTSCLKK